MGAGKAMETWGKRGRFTYQGSVEAGTKILFGRGQSLTISGAVYAELLSRFGGHAVAIGNSRRPPRGSLGSWLQTHLGRQNLAAYVGPILTTEGYAERVGDELEFKAR